MFHKKLVQANYFKATTLVLGLHLKLQQLKESSLVRHTILFSKPIVYNNYMRFTPQILTREAFIKHLNPTPQVPFVRFTPQGHASRRISCLLNCLAFSRNSITGLSSMEYFLLFY